MIILKQFYTNYVTVDLKMHKVISDSKFLFPKDTVIHHIGTSAKFGPSDFDYPFNKLSATNNFMEDIVELSSSVGRPILYGAAENKSLLRKYRQSNLKVFRYLNKPVEELKPTQVGIINYTPLGHNYRYPKNPYAAYYAWRNILGTIFLKMESIKNKNQFIFIDLDTSKFDFSQSELKRRSRLKSDMLQRSISSMIDSFFTEFMQHMIGKESLLDILSTETKATLFFVFRRNNKQIIVNLLTLEVQLGNIKDVEETVDGRYNVRKMPLLKGDQRYNIFQNMIKLTDVVKVEENPEVPSIPKEVNNTDVVNEVTTEIASTIVSKEDTDVTVEGSVLSMITQVSSNVDAPPNQARNMRQRLKKAMELKSPIPEHKGKTIQEAVVVKPEEYTLDDSSITTLPDVISSGLKATKMKSFDSKYIKTIKDKHVLASIVSMNKSGALVTDIKTEQVGSILGETTRYTIKFSPVDGVPSTVKIDLPTIEEDGTFTGNGTKYRMIKQHVDLPIRKTGPYTVYLSSNYPSKLRIIRSEMAVDSLEKWLSRQILKTGASTILDNVFDSNVRTPNLYGMLGASFRSISMHEYQLYFKYNERSQIVKDLSKYEKEGHVVVGKKGSKILTIGDDDLFYVWGSKGKKLDGSVFELFKLKESKAPKAVAMLQSLGKKYPLVIALIHHIGITKLLKYLGVKTEVVASGKRTKNPYDLRLRFEDITIYVSETTKSSAMILQGLVKLDKFTRLSPYKSFNRHNNNPPDAAEYLLLELGLTTRYAIEIDIIFSMFLDPMTIDVLKEMNEPTQMFDLFIRAVDMLDRLDHPAMTDSNYMRERGYERLAALVYKSLVRSVRSYKTSFNPKKRAVTMSSFEVYNALIKDPTVSPTKDINPVATLKDAEMVTYLGDGGRTREAMAAPSRVYHESDVGLLSEAVPDSGSTGINAYLSAQPNIKNVLGMHDSKHKRDTASTYSTNYLLMPGIDKDNPMRAVMSHIQQSHVISIKHSRPMPVKTGMEYVLPHNMSSMYANMSKADGTVKKITKNAITIERKDGTIDIYPVGVQRGTAEGKIYPHELTSNLKVGDSVKKEDVISFNNKFSSIDDLLGKVSYNPGIDLPMAFMEGPAQHEDSCTLWEGLGEVMENEILYKLEYVVSFSDSISSVPEVGSKIEAGDVVLIIEDEITANLPKKQGKLNTLLDLTRQAPKSEYTGIVDSIEMRYNGVIDDMSEGLAALARKTDKQLKDRAKDLGKTPYTGATYGELRVNGKVIGPDTAVIAIYLRYKNKLNIGDKFVFGSQLKATCGKTISKPYKTSSGVDVVGLFSYLAASNRMAPSAITVPIANYLIRHLPIILSNKYLGTNYKKKGFVEYFESIK